MYYDFICSRIAALCLTRTSTTWEWNIQMQHSLQQCAICFLLLHFFWLGFLGTTHSNRLILIMSLVINWFTDTVIDNALTYRFEKISLNKLHSIAKVMGTIITVGGAIVLTLVKGPPLCLPWAKPVDHHQSAQCYSPQTDFVKGALFIVGACFCWSWFVIFQVLLSHITISIVNYTNSENVLLKFYWCLDGY